MQANKDLKFSDLYTKVKILGCIYEKVLKISKNFINVLSFVFYIEIIYLINKFQE